MQINRINNVFTIALLMTALAGCATTTPQLDSKFGDAVNTAKAQQTVNLEASQNNNPVAGIDGKSADAVIDRYHKTYQTPPPSGNIFTIGVGGSSGSGGSTGGSSTGGMR